MFKHEQDKLCVAEFTRFQRLFDIHNSQINELLALGESKTNARTEELLQVKSDLAALEDKLDEILARLDEPKRSIPDDGTEPKPEPLAIAPGHKPWSARKREREQATHDPNFVFRISGGAKTKEPAKE
jgi:uncharacterized protein YdcH (DUF465 family)